MIRCLKLIRSGVPKKRRDRVGKLTLSGFMRKTCLDCVLKHVTQAGILLMESKLGYPNHKWWAIGHLAEAESECLMTYPTLAKRIRKERIKFITDDNYKLDFDKLINYIVILRKNND